MQRAMGLKGISCSLGKRTRNHNTEKCDESLGKTLVEKMTTCGERRVSTPRSLETEAGHTSRALVKEINHCEVPVHQLEGWRGCGAAEQEKQTCGFDSVSFGRAVTTIQQMPQKASR